MTICIAAIAEKSKITAITDKMLTLNAPVITKFEVAENDKAIKISEKTIALFAGDVIQANEIVTLVNKKGNLGDKVIDIASKVGDAYKQYCINIIDNNILSRFGLTLADFMNKQRQLDENLVRKVNDIIGNFNLDVEIIIAGIDDKPHIYKIASPGVVTAFDSIGYCCTGSGSQHATLSLIENQYHSDFKQSESLYALLEAKKRAQYDPGVGELCDIAIINDEFIRMKPEEVYEIEEIYKKSEKIIHEEKSDCAIKMDKFCSNKQE